MIKDSIYLKNVVKIGDKTYSLRADIESDKKYGLINVFLVATHTIGNKTYTQDYYVLWAYSTNYRGCTNKLYELIKRNIEYDLATYGIEELMHKGWRPLIT